VVRGLESPEGIVHLEFGTMVHSALGEYWTLRANGQDHEEALREVIKGTLEITWNPTLKRGWLGNAEKNRLTLLRTIVWYCDHYGRDDGDMEIITLGNGRLALELDFEFDSGYESPATGERVMFIGRLDSIRRFQTQDKKWIVDTKTTAQTMGQYWFKSFSPDNQFSLYDLAGKIAFGQEVEGVIVDGIQVAAGFSRFGRAEVPRTDAMRDEWIHEVQQYWLPFMTACAERAWWPQNDRACYGCRWRDICRLPPGQRELWIEKGGYRKRGPPGTIDRGPTLND
jgi:hypothetical protein